MPHHRPAGSQLTLLVESHRRLRDISQTTSCEFKGITLSETIQLDSLHKENVHNGREAKQDLKMSVM